MFELLIPQQKLKELVRQCRHLNVSPIFLSHHYPLVEQDPVALLLEELVPECVEYLSLMSEVELNGFVERIPANFRFFVDRSDSTVPQNDYLERVALYYLAALVQQDYVSFRQIVAEDVTDSTVLDAYPELGDKLDKDGLLHVDSSVNLIDGGIEYRNHVLHYHQFLRRNYTSNPNFEFLFRFMKYFRMTNKTNTFRIAIDHQRLMERRHYQQIIERDAWYGPRFDKGRLDDPLATGLTVIPRDRPSIFDSLYGELDQTEFCWSSSDGIKSFEIEELSSSGYLYESYYLNRYVHSERDIGRGVLRHFDGAVKVYVEDSYSERLTSKMPKEFKSHKKIKLFRIDGDIDIDLWVQLISMFFKGNEMILQYFDPARFEEVYGDKVRAYQEARRQEQTPE